MESDPNSSLTIWRVRQCRISVARRNRPPLRRTPLTLGSFDNPRLSIVSKPEKRCSGSLVTGSSWLSVARRVQSRGSAGRRWRRTFPARPAPPQYFGKLTPNPQGLKGYMSPAPMFPREGPIVDSDDVREAARHPRQPPRCLRNSSDADPLISKRANVNNTIRQAQPYLHMAPSGLVRFRILLSGRQ